MTANQLMEFFPKGWHPNADRFHVHLGGLLFHVERKPRDSEKPIAVFVRGIGESFRTEVEAAIHIKVVARRVDGF